MIFKDDNVLDRFRKAGTCAWCKKRGPTDAAHYRRRGMGSGGRLDVPCNLVSLCRTCHDNQHNGKRPMECDLLLLIAHREKCLQDDVLAVLNMLGRLDKRPSSFAVNLALSNLNESARKLACRTLAEAGVEVEAA